MRSQWLGWAMLAVTLLMVASGVWLIWQASQVEVMGTYFERLEELQDG